MRIFKTILLFSIFCSVAAAQVADRKFQFQGKFDFESPSEPILVYKFLQSGNLRLIGPNTFQIWDVSDKKVIESRRHEIKNLTPASFGAASPDKNKILVLGGLDFEKNPFPTSVWEAESGKRIAVLDKSSRPIRSAVWSKNGETLVTADNASLKNSSVREKRTEFCFWDGKTLEFRACVFLDDVTWRYLSHDGRSLFTTSVPSKKGFLGIPFTNGMANVIRIWDARTGKNDKNLSVGDDNFATLTWKLMPSPDGRFFALVSKNKDKDDDHRILVWEIESLSELPKYIIKANPKVGDSSLRYTPDGKYFALDAGKNAQVYELETGRLKYEIVDADVPDFWLSDNRIALYRKTDKIKALEVADQKLVFEEKVAYATTERVLATSTDSNGVVHNQTETEIVDWTEIVPHPARADYFIAYSNDSVKVYDSSTGTNLGILVSPPLKFERKKKKILGIPLPRLYPSQRKLVSRAEWSEDGRSIFILNGTGTSVSIWKANL